MRVRITFSKGAKIRFTGHLDLIKIWERTFRRAGLPLAYSLGFNPRPKINIASPLPLGYTSDAEILDLWLENPIPLTEIDHRLIPKIPPGITIQSISEVDTEKPSLQSLLASADYKIQLLTSVPDLESGLAGLEEMECIEIQKKGKVFDMKPLIEDINLVGEPDQPLPFIFVRLKISQNETGRPADLLAVLGIETGKVRIKRTRLNFFQ